nr:hypothetical protein CFP56_24077 [Quercus suber]
MLLTSIAFREPQEAMRHWLSYGHLNILLLHRNPQECELAHIYIPNREPLDQSASSISTVGFQVLLRIDPHSIPPWRVRLLPARRHGAEQIHREVGSSTLPGGEVVRIFHFLFIRYGEGFRGGRQHCLSLTATVSSLRGASCYSIAGKGRAAAFSHVARRDLVATISDDCGVDTVLRSKGKEAAVRPSDAGSDLVATLMGMGGLVYQRSRVGKVSWHLGSHIIRSVADWIAPWYTSGVSNVKVRGCIRRRHAGILWLRAELLLPMATIYILNVTWISDDACMDEKSSPMPDDDGKNAQGCWVAAAAADDGHH